RADRQWIGGNADAKRTEYVSDIPKLWLRNERLPHLLHFAGGLIHDGPAVDDVNESAWETGRCPSGGVPSQRQKPNRDDRGLAEARRNVARLWKRLPEILTEQLLLPRKRGMASQ